MRQAKHLRKFNLQRAMNRKMSSWEILSGAPSNLWKSFSQWKHRGIFFLSKVPKLQNPFEIIAFGARDGYLNLSESAVGHIFIGLFLRFFFFSCASYTLSKSVCWTCSERETWLDVKVKKKKTCLLSDRNCCPHDCVKNAIFKTRQWSVTTSSGMSNALRRYFLPKQKISFLIRRLILSQKIVKEDMIAIWKTIVNFGLSQSIFKRIFARILSFCLAVRCLFICSMLIWGGSIKIVSNIYGIVSYRVRSNASKYLREFLQFSGAYNNPPF